jgi:hypothetical protein
MYQWWKGCTSGGKDVPLRWKGCTSGGKDVPLRWKGCTTDKLILTLFTAVSTIAGNALDISGCFVCMQVH